jgi:hypothetical protein
MYIVERYRKDSSSVLSSWQCTNIILVFRTCQDLELVGPGWHTYVPNKGEHEGCRVEYWNCKNVTIFKKMNREQWPRYHCDFNLLRISLCTESGQPHTLLPADRSGGKKIGRNIPLPPGRASHSGRLCSRLWWHWGVDLLICKGFI